MPTTEQRLVTIDNKIITLANVRALANELHSIYKRKGKDSAKKLDIEVYCAENVVFTSADAHIFSEDSPLVSKRVWFIEMGLFLVEPSKAVKIKLMHSPSKPYENTIIVTGDDSNWVNGTLKKLEEIVDSFEPQNTFIKRFQIPLLFIFDLTLGLAIFNAINLILGWLFPIPQGFTLSGAAVSFLKTNRNIVLFLYYLITLSLVMWIGKGPAARLMAWLVGLFPSVELQIGPEHKLSEKRRRVQIATFVSVTGIVSLLLQLGYEAAVYFIR